ncbi:hypothetical protein A6F68_00811 [Tsuneonella dongtanensis]|uniref:3-keto-alpha-glucoside-1,2-lyase/3-keto-2-hydroxy-glucal hydratase domain-containing protein n=1 Tax=Tsuneonella dongtanensis TaxID=692370 RepID=A0A1B2AAZ5_9SPHN|nr:DUF1080 domain-containing protein [Tsuneonella dongtanensis]ANY19337.1 hypothetical protein A6F68_00811 [Tsuneonella dongtanensis]
MSIVRLTATTFAASVTLSAAIAAAQETGRPGFTDTPMLPGGEWHVHDPARPYPERIMPGSTDAAPPSDAKVLFDGSGLGSWEMLDGGPIDWQIDEGVLTVTPSAERKGFHALRTREGFGDIQLHVEYRTPVGATGEGQKRGNSGIYVMCLYEVQILDSHAVDTYADGQAGAIYGQYPPLVQASRPAGAWQSFDIVFEAPRREEDGVLLEPAYMTVLHNGVLVQNRRALLGPTVWRQLATYDEPHADRLPLCLQDHDDPVQFRNVWLREID